MNDGVNRGYKDFNSSIHLLEGLSTLYQAWPDTLVKKRLEEMLVIIRDTMIHPDGYLIQYFHGNWERVAGEVLAQRTRNDKWLGEPITFGHDIETAYLLIEAAEVLGWEESAVMPTAVKLTEHTIRFGWDPVNGGIFDDGSHITADSVVIINDHKSWWAEVESLNTLLLMSEKVPAERDKYFDLFVKQWDYIDKYLIDHTHGEFYSHGTDTDPETVSGMKAHAWKTPYHITRALVNCLRLLEDTEHHH
jgi:mannobiose 2-epimerase